MVGSRRGHRRGLVKPTRLRHLLSLPRVKTTFLLDRQIYGNSNMIGARTAEFVRRLM